MKVELAVRIVVGDKELCLTEEQARFLLDELEKRFEKKVEPIVIRPYICPEPYIQPYTPYNPWTNPWSPHVTWGTATSTADWTITLS
jgi:hypothetical protein